MFFNNRIAAEYKIRSYFVIDEMVGQRILKLYNIIYS